MSSTMPTGVPAPGLPSAPKREGWLTTQLESYVNWGRKNALWPMPFGTACCAIEFMSVVSSHYDLSRFGAEVVRFSPRQSDLMIVAGTVVDKMGPVLKQIWDQMPDPKWCIAMGVCASSAVASAAGSPAFMAIWLRVSPRAIISWSFMMPWIRPSGVGGQPGT